MSSAISISTLDEPPPGPRPGLDEAIDFVNTTGISKGKPFEDLGSISDALHWLHAAGFLSHDATLSEYRRFASDPNAADLALRRARTMRAGLRELIDALADERDPAAGSVQA